MVSTKNTTQLFGSETRDSALLATKTTEGTWHASLFLHCYSNMKLPKKEAKGPLWKSNFINKKNQRNRGGSKETWSSNQRGGFERASWTPVSPSDSAEGCWRCYWTLFAGTGHWDRIWAGVTIACKLVTATTKVRRKPRHMTEREEQLSQANFVARLQASRVLAWKLKLSSLDAVKFTRRQSNWLPFWQ